MRPLILILLLAVLLPSCTNNTLDKGLIIKESPHSVEATYTKLRTLLSNNPKLKILLELDHSENARSVDLELKPTKIILFGNPKLGTPLMQSTATASIDLPQKIIVYTDEGNRTKIAYNDPWYLQKRHGIEGKGAILEKVGDALHAITEKVIAKE